MTDEERHPLPYESPPPRDVNDDVRLYFGLAVAIVSFAAAALGAGVGLYHWLRG